MPRAASRDPIYYRRRSPAEVIELCVRWYLTYKLSYRDLAVMMAERDVAVTHTTILRWVQRYVPEFERRWARFSRPVGSSWRMDETALSIRGECRYLYRAVDRDGKSVHSLLCEDRTVDSAQEFFRQAVKVAGSGWPEKVNLDGNTATHCALRLLGEEDSRWLSVNVRARRYLNNVVEQDHRAIKQRCAPMLGPKSFATAAVTLSGIELAHRIRKRQYTLPYEHSGGMFSLKELWDQVIAGKGIPEGVEISRRPLTHYKDSPCRVNRSGSYLLLVFASSCCHRCLKRQTAALQPASLWAQSRARATMKAARSGLTPDSAFDGPRVNQVHRTPV